MLDVSFILSSENYRKCLVTQAVICSSGCGSGCGFFGSVAMPSPPHTVIFYILIVEVSAGCFNYFISHLIGCCLRRCWKLQIY